MTDALRPTRAARPSAPLRIGCSGWQYKHWRGGFYPQSLPQSRWLEYYAARFDTVEVNNSFYRLPSADTFSAWRSRVPRGFLFAVKASRYLTHMKKLKDPEPPLELFFSRAACLRDRLGPVLYQLPPRWPCNLDRLEVFLRALPARRRHAIEFRDPRWYHEAVFALLERHHVALCLHDMAGSASGRLRVGPFVYVRFHGPQRYSGSYSDAELQGWAEWLAEQRRETSRCTRTSTTTPAVTHHAMRSACANCARERNADVRPERRHRYPPCSSLDRRVSDGTEEYESGARPQTATQQDESHSRQAAEQGTGAGSGH